MEIISFLFSILMIICVASFFSLAPWLPTRLRDLKRIHDIMALGSGAKMLEIWCGNARVSLYMAHHNPNAFITGIELSPLFYIISKIRVHMSGLKNIQIVYWNALHYNISDYDALYVFGLPQTVNQQIAPKLKKEMKSTAVFYSYCFHLEDEDFIHTQHKPDSKNYSLHEYKYRKL